MLGLLGTFISSQRLFEQWFGFIVLLLCLVELGQTIETIGDIRVIWTYDVLPNSQRALE